MKQQKLSLEEQVAARRLENEATNRRKLLASLSPEAAEMAKGWFADLNLHQSVTREEGLRQIDAARWEKDDDGALNLFVAGRSGIPIHAWLTMRPSYCDRGHIQLNIDGPLGLDEADSFPRYFFSFPEADLHTRAFLKWRLWLERTASSAEILRAFEKQ